MLRGRLSADPFTTMQPRRALLTCAGPNQRTLPLQSLVDRDGATKTALAIIVEEILTSRH